MSGLFLATQGLVRCRWCGRIEYSANMDGRGLCCYCGRRREAGRAHAARMRRGERGRFLPLGAAPSSGVSGR